MTYHRPPWNVIPARPHLKGRVPTVPDDGPWLDTLIGLGHVWLFPTAFLPGAEQVAGLDVRHAAGIHMPYLAHPVHRVRPHLTREDTCRA